jgi:hypothetical protein
LRPPKRSGTNLNAPVDLESVEFANSGDSETSYQEYLMTELPGHRERTGDLQELSDPEFFVKWAAVRNSLFSVSKGKPGYCEVKRRYDAVAAEYRRRIDGSLPRPVRAVGRGKKAS